MPSLVEIHMDNVGQKLVIFRGVSLPEHCVKLLVEMVQSLIQILVVIGQIWIQAQELMIAGIMSAEIK